MKSEGPIDLKKLELGTCFFCDKLVIFRDKRLLSLEDIENLRKLFGYVPERFGSMIGNEVVCKSCKGDIWVIAQSD